MKEKNGEKKFEKDPDVQIDYRIDSNTSKI